jgi:hypothetical protein
MHWVLIAVAVALTAAIWVFVIVAQRGSMVRNDDGSLRGKDCPSRTSSSHERRECEQQGK